MSQTQLSILRGRNKSITLTFIDEKNAAINLTGYTIYFYVKESIKDGDVDAKIKKEITEHSDPTAGKSEINLLPDDTKDLVPKNYLFEVATSSGDGHKYTVTSGLFVVEKTVIKDIP